jgi:hypothetical protein
MVNARPSGGGGSDGTEETTSSGSTDTSTDTDTTDDQTRTEFGAGEARDSQQESDTTEPVDDSEPSGTPDNTDRGDFQEGVDPRVGDDSGTESGTSDSTRTEQGARDARDSQQDSSTTQPVESDPSGTPDGTNRGDFQEETDPRVGGQTRSPATESRIERIAAAARQQQAQQTTRTEARAQQLAEDRVDADYEAGLEAMDLSPLQAQAQELERQAVQQFDWAEDTSDIAVFRQDGQLVARPTRSALVDATAQQIEGELQAQRASAWNERFAQDQNERERAVAQLEAQLEAQTGVDLTPGEDFVVEQTNDGQWQARLVAGYGTREERLEQASRQDDIFSGAVGTVQDVTGIGSPVQGSVVNRARVRREFAQANNEEQFGDSTIYLGDVLPTETGATPAGGQGPRVEDVLKETSKATQEEVWDPVTQAAGWVARSPGAGGVYRALDPAGVTASNPDEREAVVEGAVEGVGTIADPAGLVLTVKEAAEFGGAAAAETAQGDGGEFASEAAAAAALAGAGFTRQAMSEPRRTGGQVAGSLIASGGVIGGARRVGGAGAGRAASWAIQPGEEAAITAARAGAVPTRLARAVPGVREGHIDPKTQGSTSESDVQRTDLPDERPETLTTQMVDDAQGVSGPSRRARARRRARDIFESARDRVGGTSVEWRAGAGLVPPRVETESRTETGDSGSGSGDAPFTDYDPSRSEVLEGSPRDQMSGDVTRRSRQQREQATGDYEGVTDPLEPTGGRQGPIFTEDGDVVGLDPVRPRRSDAAEAAASGRLLTPEETAAASGGLAAAVTYGARERLRDAQMPAVTETEVLRGRAEMAGTGLAVGTGAGAMSLLDTASMSISDFQGNLVGAETRVEAGQQTQARTDPLVETDPRSDVRSDQRTDTRQDTRQETRQEQRSETRQETRLEARPETRVETGVEERTELREEVRQELFFETRWEPRSEGSASQSDALPGPRSFETEPVVGPVTGTEPDLAPGWLQETIFTIATGGTQTPQSPTQEVLESQPVSQQRTGELPIAQVLEDEETAAVFEDVQSFFDPGAGAGDTGGGWFDFDFGVDDAGEGWI